MKKLFFFAAVFCCLSLGAGKSFACSCITSEGSAEQQVREAIQTSSAVFLAKAVSVKRESTKSGNDGAGRLLVSLEVERSWKNKLARRVKIYTNLHSAACGYPFKAGKKYLVYAGENKDGSLWTTNCSRTSLLTRELADIKLLDSIKPPKSKQKQ